MRVLAAEATLSSSALACSLLPRLRDSKNPRSSPATTWATILDAGGVPRISLVCPSNCGSGSRTAITAVRPSSTSSLVTGSSPFFSSLAARSCSFSVRTSARSNPATCVPPFGVAITLTKDLVTLKGGTHVALRRGDHVDEGPGHAVISGPPAQRHIDIELALDLGRGQVALVIEDRHGLGELARAGQPHYLGDRIAGREVSAELADSAGEPELRLLRAGQPVIGRPGRCLVMIIALIMIGDGPQPRFRLARRRPPGYRGKAHGRALIPDPDGEPGHQVGGLAGGAGGGGGEPARGPPPNPHAPAG